MALPRRFVDLRGEFLTGAYHKSKKTLDDTWYNKNLQDLLTAHYDVFKAVALNDVESMLESEHTKMTITQQKRKDSPVPLPPLALRLIQTWYDEKQDAGGRKFNKKAEDRKLARTNHNEQMGEHSRTQEQNLSLQNQLRDQDEKLEMIWSDIAALKLKLNRDETAMKEHGEKLDQILNKQSSASPSIDITTPEGCALVRKRKEADLQSVNQIEKKARHQSSECSPNTSVTNHVHGPYAGVVFANSVRIVSFLDICTLLPIHAKITGLQNARELTGKTSLLINWSKEKQRFRIDMDDSNVVAWARPMNLEIDDTT